MNRLSLVLKIMEKNFQCLARRGVFFTILVPHAAGAARQLDLVIRQGMGLQVVDQLQFVLQITPKTVGLLESLVIVHRDELVIHQQV